MAHKYLDFVGKKVLVLGKSTGDDESYSRAHQRIVKAGNIGIIKETYGKEENREEVREYAYVVADLSEVSSGIYLERDIVPIGDATELDNERIFTMLVQGKIDNKQYKRITEYVESR